MARVWTDLADKQNSVFQHMPTPSQPIAQQQQQVQPKKDDRE